MAARLPGCGKLDKLDKLGIEGTGSDGTGLTRHLLEQHVEVNEPTAR